jgi:hypothetical protein
LPTTTTKHSPLSAALNRSCTELIWNLHLMRTRMSLRTGHALAFLTAASLLAVATGCPSKPDAPPAPDATGYGQSKTPFDPVVANGTIFEGWTKPQLTLLLTGELLGYLEPCGCAGLENQKGGLNRRQSLLNQLRDPNQRGWEVLPLDLGGLVRRYGPQAEIKFQTASDGLRKLGYQAVGLGVTDLHLPVESLLASIGNEDKLFVAANVGLLGFDSDFTVPHKIIEAGGRRVGITAILGDRYRQELNTSDIETIPAAEGLALVAPTLQEQSDFRILLSHATPEESLALAQQFPIFDIVVTAGGAEEPPAQPQVVPGTNTWLIEVGHKGMYAAAIGLYDDPQNPRRYQRVPLDSRFPNTPEMTQLLTDYQQQLETLGFDALGVRPTRHPRTDPSDPLSGLFVGAARCGTCHTKAHAKWETSKHAHATETLTKLTPHRQFDPECISCHATGWNPQEYFPWQSGYESMEATPHLAGNSCENCHGPGAAHTVEEELARGLTPAPIPGFAPSSSAAPTAAAPTPSPAGPTPAGSTATAVATSSDASGDLAKNPTDRTRPDLKRRDQLRAAMRLTQNTVETTCRSCHDHDNSPEFNFDQYWAKVKHPGKD